MQLSVVYNREKEEVNIFILNCSQEEKVEMLLVRLVQTNRMLKTVRRFSKRFGEERDRKWLGEFCCNNGIDYGKKVGRLKSLLKKL